MSITSTFMRSVLVASLLATGAVLGGCEGDDGLDGAQGPPGEPGETGPTGPQGPAGVVTTKPLESCGVCHDTGKAYDAGAGHADALLVAMGQGQVDVSNVAFQVAGADLVVSFNLKVNGVNATDFNSITSRNGSQTAYRFDGAVRNSLSPNATLAGGAGGNYTITVAGGAANAAINSRYLFRVANPADERALVVGDFPVSPVVALVSDQACVNCHGASATTHHYDYETGAQQCVVCHTSNAPALVEVVHGIHNSANRPSGAWEDYEHITYPTYMTNCSVCHSEPAMLAAANAMPVTGAGCFTCHESMEGFGEDAFAGSTFHLNYDETTNCGNCHDDNTAPSTITAFHNGLATERAGIIWDGVDTSVTEGAKFDWQIVEVVDNGTTLAISWLATYDPDGADGPTAPIGVDPCNATPAANAPAFHAIPPFGTTNRNNLSVLYTYLQGEDPILGTVAGQAGQAANVGVTTTNTTCDALVATTTIEPTRFPGATVGRIALQGKPWVLAVNPADADGVMQVRAKTPVYDFALGSGEAAQARREIVDTGKCLNCHVGSLYQHGGNRVDNVDMCILCHNSASNEQYVREDIYNIDASVAYDGKAGQTFEMKSMLHAIHSAGEVGAAPIVIYRPSARGIYAWAPDESLLQNWPGTGANPVFGSDSGLTPNHNFHSPDYPRFQQDCGGCHSDTFVDLLPDQTKAMATTLEAGKKPWENQDDDVLQGVGAAACTSCHSDGAAKGHAYQNGWTPQAFENGRQTIIDATK
jgi:OmcA/MtrC family decaheme c-type cytochrome